MLLLVALCLVVGMSGAANASPFTLYIDWLEEIPEDDQLIVVIQFRSNGGDVLWEDELFYVSTNQNNVSKWDNDIVPPPLATSVRWFIDSPFVFDPMEEEVPLPQNVFYTEIVPDP